VLGDAYGAGIVHHLSRKDLQRMDEEDRLNAELDVTADDVKQTNDVKADDAKTRDVTEMKLYPKTGAENGDAAGHRDTGHVNITFNEKL
jgi:hypothetical protein